MTAQVVAARPDTPYKELARLLREHRVSALPVVDERHHVLGIVSEADLLLKQEYPSGLRHALWYESKRRRVEQAKARGATAADLMTIPAVTIGRDATVAEAARLMHAEGVKRLPVDDALGRLVGIVSRGDLLAVVLRPDAQIRREIVDVIRHDLLMSPDRFTVEVRDGVVALQGQVERRSLIPLLVRAVDAVDGVVRVHDRLGCDFDDTHLAPPGPRAHAI
ncbi:MAG TPA: CBS domain-containing protein [Actinomycetes bacterium]|nr:CBS domain-containing protein [Actinomycetes bacterium]